MKDIRFTPNLVMNARDVDIDILAALSAIRAREFEAEKASFEKELAAAKHKLAQANERVVELQTILDQHLTDVELKGAD